jgi:hypothetical protein
MCLFLFFSRVSHVPCHNSYEVQVTLYMTQNLFKWSEFLYPSLSRLKHVHIMVAFIQDGPPNWLQSWFCTLV